MTDPPLCTASEVGEAILAAPQKPMTRTESEIMLRLIVAETAGEEFTLGDEALPFALRIAKKRAAAFKVPVTDAALLMTTALCDNPGAIVMYCAVLKVLADRLGRAATISDICDAFPMGFPDDAAMTAIWDRQKNHDGHGSDNWLDRAEAWE